MANNSSGNVIRKVFFNSARHALRWLERGIYPVPLESKSKRPKGERPGSAKGADGWTELRVTKDTVHKHFKPGDNVGGLWGEPSAWAVDVDLDTYESQVIAPHYLPETLIYGRGKAPGSHYIYHCRNAETKKYQTKDIGMIVEIRSTGSQSVLPASVHPTGDRYEINHDVEIAEIKWNELRRLVGRVAAASIAAHYYPDEGSRHDYVHALTGSLLHAHWKDDDVRKFMKAVRSAAGTDEEKADRDGTIENTIKSFKAGGNVQGLPTLSQFMTGLDLQNFKRFLSLDVTIPDNDPAPDAIHAEPVASIPEKLLEVPGLVGRVAQWSESRSFVKQPLFDLAVGLMSVAMASRNKYRIGVLDTPLQPYFMCVAPTSCGKENALKSVYYIASRIGLKDYVMKQSQSYHAMLDVLAQPPHTLVWLWDECARYMRSAGKNLGGQEHHVLSHALSLYGQGGSMTPGVPARKNPIPPLNYPFFMIMAAAQPEQILQAVTGNDMAEGMINRFILFDAVGAFPRDNDARRDMFPSHLENDLNAFEKIKLPEGEFKDVDFADMEAWQTINDFRTYAREAGSRQERGSELWGRAAQNAFILGGLVAIGIDKDHPIITREIAQWAVDFSSWSVDRWLNRIDQSAARSFIERDSKTVERVIRNPIAYKWSAVGNRPEMELIQKGLCPKSLIMRVCRHIKSKDLNEILTHLVLAELVCASEVNDRDCYWARHTITSPTSKL